MHKNCRMLLVLTLLFVAGELPNPFPAYNNGDTIPAHWYFEGQLLALRTLRRRPLPLCQRLERSGPQQLADKVADLRTALLAAIPAGSLVETDQAEPRGGFSVRLKWWSAAWR